MVFFYFFLTRETRWRPTFHFHPTFPCMEVKRKQRAFLGQGPLHILVFRERETREKRRIFFYLVREKRESGYTYKVLFGWRDKWEPIIRNGAWKGKGRKKRQPMDFPQKCSEEKKSSVEKKGAKLTSRSRSGRTTGHNNRGEMRKVTLPAATKVPLKDPIHYCQQKKVPFEAKLRPTVTWFPIEVEFLRQESLLFSKQGFSISWECLFVSSKLPLPSFSLTTGLLNIFKKFKRIRGFWAFITYAVVQ